MKIVYNWFSPLRDIALTGADLPNQGINVICLSRNERGDEVQRILLKLKTSADCWLPQTCPVLAAGGGEAAADRVERQMQN